MEQETQANEPLLDNLGIQESENNEPQRDVVVRAEPVHNETITLRIHRFTPRPQRDRARGGSPFAKKSSSPFGDSSRSSRKPRGKQWVQDYELMVRPDDTILDCLLTIKREVDPTLAFRYSCGHGMCGSDAVAVNGTPVLLCKAHISDWLEYIPHETHDDEGFRRTGNVDDDAIQENKTASSYSLTQEEQSRAHHTVIELAPLPGFSVERDLVVNLDPMLNQIKQLKPYLIADGTLATTVDGNIDLLAYIQSPEQLHRYEILSTCITCGVCEGSCPVYAGGEAFIGPAALINQARFVRDSRDQATSERLEAIDTADGVQACQSVRACSRECPVGIDVGEELWQLIAQVKEREVEE